VTRAEHRDCSIRYGIIREPRTDDYGDDYWADRTYGALDPEGHLWWFMQRMREPKSHAK